MTAKTHTRPAKIATLVLILGVCTSVGGNLQAINLGSTAPGIGAYVSALFWPLSLFLAIELMLHTPWINSRRDALTKWAGLTGVAGMAAWISYWHLAHVLTAYNYDFASAHVGPLAIDGFMAMATLALNRVGQARRTAVATVATPAVQMDTTPAVATSSTVATWTATDQNMFDRLATELDSSTTPATPLDTTDTSRTSNEVKPESVPAEFAELISAWDGQTLRKGEVDALLAGHFSVTPRTARRWRGAVTGAPVSPAPLI